MGLTGTVNYFIDMLDLNQKKMTIWERRLQQSG